MENIVDLIKTKRNGKPWSKKQVEAFIVGVVEDEMTKAQIGACLMAIFLNNMSSDEISYLTNAMVHSGDVLSWPEEWRHKVVDKHSTGGIGDKLSLPLVPALAACGLKVPMISGRGLEIASGTLDKLESIPGYRVSLSKEEIETNVREIGCCIAAQTQSLVPADRLLYAERDTTGTVDSLPLIVGSIMSKKAAEGLSCLVLEVTYGKAAFMKTIDEARKLAEAMVESGNQNGIKTSAYLLKMDHPFGNLVGHSLEIIESVRCLSGQGPDVIDLLVAKLGGSLLLATGEAKSQIQGEEMIMEKLKNGEAKEKFKAMLLAQGVSQRDVDALFNNDIYPNKVLPSAKHVEQLKAHASGYVHEIDALICGRVVFELGGGRLKPSDSINHATGIELTVDRGAFINQGDVWIKLYHDEDVLPSGLLERLRSALQVEPDPPTEDQLQIITGYVQ